MYILESYAKIWFLLLYKLKNALSCNFLHISSAREDFELVTSNRDVPNLTKEFNKHTPGYNPVMKHFWSYIS